MPFIARILLLASLAACGNDEQPVPSNDEGGEEAEAAAVGRCDYLNSFSQTAECKEYLGGAWTVERAADDCTVPMIGAEPGAFSEGVPCERTSILGECVIGEDTDEHTVLVFPGSYGDSCDGLELGCSFAQGEFVPSQICDGSSSGGGGTASVFRPFEQICVEPLAGEPAGASDDGKVCTWQAISGATEPGRSYSEYADCSTVITQRPYWPAAATANTPSDDPRLTDTAFQAELAWVTKEVEATACVCCHTQADSPNGEPSGWFLEAEPIWTDTLDDDGLAMLAGWIDSTAFGAFPAEENNGFSREKTGIPTTDPDRMKAFLEDELSRRGVDASDFASATPFGGPLYDQLVYEPSACADGVGIDAGGTITWSGGNARYVYVLGADSAPPGVPPNLDLPDGTVWRIDVDWQDAPIASGIAYGEAPDGAFQSWPASGAPPALASGQTYFLYVLADVYQPLTRCLFQAP